PPTQGVTVLATTVIEPMLRSRLAGGDAREAGAAAPGNGAVDADTVALRDAVARLGEIVRASPGLLDPARLLISGAVLLHDGPALLAGWRSYYLVATSDSLTGPLAEPRRVLAARLPAWAGDAERPEERDDLVRALASSRFFDAAAVLALEPLSGGPSLASRDRRAAEVVAYAGFIRGVGRITDEYYRQTALGKGNRRAWMADLDSAARALWPRLAWSGAAPAFKFDGVPAELDRRFGALVNFGETAGYQDLHMGHRVVDARRTVQQYGHEANVRFIALDAVVSNGFQSWAWMGRAAHGGWGGSELIVQVRPRYAEGPLAAWWDATDSVARRKVAAEIAVDSAADLVRARTTPVAFFPGVAKRFARDARERLLDSLRGTGLAGRALEAEFERAYGAATQESSIFAHEGRHAIDATMGLKPGPAELEFRAKLSEVAFAPSPRLALGGIISATLGDRTPHGQANERVMRGVLAWMRAHAGEIRGLDRAAPLLPQMPVLSDEQLRRAFASMDPLAGASGAGRR
ncbi:MAG: hypothetical protein WKG32_21370, partial [Gemmatimonadaceae bacterium]